MQGFINTLVNIYESFLSIFSPSFREFINLFFIVIFILSYAIFVWKFYRFIARKNIIELNLNRHNKSENPIISKVFTSAFYFIENIIFMPFLIFFWFGVFTIFIILLNENLDLKSILLISATIVTAIRITSYYKETLAQELAKLLPFTLLAVSIINKNFGNIEKIITQLGQISIFLNNVFIYFLFILTFELILRFFDLISSLFGYQKKDLERTTNA